MAASWTEDRLARALLDGRKTILAVQFEEMPEPDQIEELA